MAAHNGGFKVVNWLCGKKPPIGRDRTDSNARNALHYAVSNQNEEAPLGLIECGIDINMLDHLGRPPVLYAAMNKMERVVDSLLTQAEIDLTTLPRYRGNDGLIGLTPQEAYQQQFETLEVMLRERRRAQVDREKVERGQNGDQDPEVEVKAPSATATPNSQSPSMSVNQNAG